MSKYKPRLPLTLQDLMIELVEIALDQPSPTSELTSVLDRIVEYKAARAKGMRTLATYRQRKRRKKLKDLKLLEERLLEEQSWENMMKKLRAQVQESTS